jgi:coenzyme F420-reducing hydrogenase gamma subunit
MEETAQTLANVKKEKMSIGWFSFTCCEDSTILFTELLNDNLDDWKKVVDFKHVKALKTTNVLKDLDVAFVEGAISSDSQADEVKKIRDNAKYVVAIGSCACTGMPSGSRNDFKDEQINERIAWYLSHFDYSDKVRKLEEVITVDDKVDGCPMSVDVFTEILTKYLKIYELV